MKKNNFEGLRDELYENFLAEDTTRSVYLAHPCTDTLKGAAQQIVGQRTKEETTPARQHRITDLTEKGLILSGSVQRLISMLESEKNETVTSLKAAGHFLRSKII